MNARTLGSLSGRVFSHKGRSSNAKTSAAVQLVTVVMVVLFWSPQVDAYPQDKIYFAFLDWQLVQLTQAITKNPVIPLSAPKAVQGKAVQDGMSLADYKRDVEQAAAIHYRWRVEAARYNNGEIDRATYEAAIKNSSADYLSLYNKWWAAGRRSDFERDYQQRLNAMGWPVRPPKVVQGMPSADYKRDVEQAADLEFRKGQFRSDYENKEIDAATEDKSIKALDAVLTRLNEKWRVAGRGNEFRRDCMQQLRVVAIAHQSHPQPWRIPSGNLFAYTMVALLLLALGLAREIGPFGLDNADPFTIRSGWHSTQPD